MPYSEIINRTQRAYFLNKQNKIYESLLDIIEINKIKEKIKVNPSEPTLHITIGELVNKYYNNKITDIENKQEIESLFDIILSEFDNIKDAEWYFKKALDISQNPMEVDDYITSNYEYATFLHNRGNNDDKERAVSLLKEAYLTAKKYNEILSVNTIKNLLRKLNIEENQVIE